MIKVEKWKTAQPESCDICEKKLKKYFIDGKTFSGLWAIMCENCHKTEGWGLGIGKGQKYEVKED